MDALTIIIAAVFKKEILLLDLLTPVMSALSRDNITETTVTLFGNTEATISSSLLQCPICICLYCEPISLSCGHTFCRPCLASSLSKTKKKCPTCRAVCHISAYGASENVALATVARTCFPEEYAARLPDIAAARSELELEMPVFYYNEVQFPGHQLGLHLFEERYRLMMKRVTESTNCFAYLPNFVDYQAHIGDIGVVAKVDECEFFHDGRCNMQATLTRRFRVETQWIEDGTQNLTYVKVRYLDDVPLEGEAATALEAVAKQCVEVLALIEHTPEGT